MFDFFGRKKLRFVLQGIIKLKGIDSCMEMKGKWKAKEFQSFFIKGGCDIEKKV